MNHGGNISSSAASGSVAEHDGRPAHGRAGVDVSGVARDGSVPPANPPVRIPPNGSGGATGVGRTGKRRRPPKLYRIGEVVSYSGMSRQTIHNYTTMGLLRESHWTAGGHRLYDESVFERLDAIAELKARSRSLAEIREYFAEEETRQNRQA